MVHLFYEHNYIIDYVYSRNIDDARQLANIAEAKFTNDLNDINSCQSDLIVIAISDSSIATVASKLTVSIPLVHTSGSIGIDVLKEGTSLFGSFYPLQTFLKGKKIDFLSVPLCIEGNTDEVEEELERFAKEFSNKVAVITSEQRLRIHLSAVFACNFSNHMLAIAQDLCEQNNVPFEFLKPLINETFSKIENSNPIKHQTGPAIREDRVTMEKHNNLLIDNSVYKELYNLISDSIIRFKHD